ncbi:MAG: sigma-54 dependent transcriptional regulator [Planctomycetota bacterium]|nr:sigma-54 dependent transcriptional regulator [Planctomycetota bacterium]
MDKDDANNFDSARILVVDNETPLAQVMVESLERIGLNVDMATSGPEGAEKIRQGSYDVVVSDLVMNDLDGMGILKTARESSPESEVILVTGHASIPKAVEAMQEGAFNFLEKPITPKKLQAIVGKAIESSGLRKQNLELNRRLDEKFGFENLIYASQSMQAVVDRLKRIAPTDAGVLITGETGAGKDVVAQAIHQNSPRKNRPFVAINTAAVSQQLVESELFGHVKGAFTDAIADREGKFEYANGGTLFLDEIGDMPMPTQIKLLRVLEERQITRVGDNKSKPVNVRVIAATNKNLEQEIEKGNFRSDLYFRLKIVSVHLDPLSRRKDDIVPLADLFRKQAASKHGKKIRNFSPELTKWMFNYQWKGNVRQLRNVVESLVVLDIDGVLDLDDLSPDLLEEQPIESIASSPAPTNGLNPLVGKSWKEIETYIIRETLKLVNHNRKDTAKILGMSERSLYRKIDAMKEQDELDEVETARGEFPTGDEAPQDPQQEN